MASKPFKHQQEVINDDPDYPILALGTGSGKTRTALEITYGKTLVICPKQQKVDKTWEREREKWGIVANIEVISKEQFRSKQKKMGYYDTIIIDECHEMLGLHPDTVRRDGRAVPKTSQLFDSILAHSKEHTPKKFILVSATPIPKPMNLLAIAWLFGKDWDFIRFRNNFYFRIKKGWREFWVVDKKQNDYLTEVFHKHFTVYTGQLSDWFDVPDQIHKEVKVDLTTQQKKKIKEVEMTEADPMSVRASKRAIENGIYYDIEIEEGKKGDDILVRSTEEIKNNKIKHILSFADEFPKLLIFAYFTGQVESIVKELKDKGYNARAVTSKSKDRDTIFQYAEENDCILVVQASISSGWEWKSCNCVIFASKSYRYVDYHQALGRVLRSDAIKKNLYVHLITKGDIDERCHKTILDGDDFQEKLINYEGD